MSIVLYGAIAVLKFCSIDLWIPVPCHCALDSSERRYDNFAANRSIEPAVPRMWNWPVSSLRRSSWAPECLEVQSLWQQGPQTLCYLWSFSALSDGEGGFSRSPTNDPNHRRAVLQGWQSGVRPRRPQFCSSHANLATLWHSPQKRQCISVVDQNMPARQVKCHMERARVRPWRQAGISPAAVHANARLQTRGEAC